MRTQDEIVKRFEEKRKEPLCFEPEVLFECLDFEHAKPFLKPEATKKAWNDTCPASTRANVLERAKAYMEEFGWPKCQDHRGISADRTIQKMTAWAWLLKEDELVRKIENAPYQNYGAPKLQVICEHFDWPIPDDEASQRMMKGQSCCDDCSNGCGR